MQKGAPRGRLENGFHAPEDLYRQHWWQWLRPPPPQHVKEAWKEEARAAKEARRAAPSSGRSDAQVAPV